MRHGQMFNSEDKIAWKTGTSVGHRDAWAIGITSDYVVGVWAGNADGEGRPNLTGISAAAPMMFEVFDKLPSSTWFFPPMMSLPMLLWIERVVTWHLNILIRLIL